MSREFHVLAAHRSFDGLGLEALFVDDGRPARVEALEAASRVVCWFGARHPVFVSRLTQAAPSAIVAPPAGDGTVAVWEHLLQAVAAPAGDWCGGLAVPPALRADGHRALRAAGWDGATPLLLVHPGAGGPGKRWPAVGFARVLADVLGERRVSVVIHAGPADGDAAAALASALDGTALVLEDPPLPQLAGALAHAAAYLGNDSGVSHLAAAVGVPSLILFEAAQLPWRPWGAAARPLVVATSALEAGDVSAVGAGLRALLGWRRSGRPPRRRSGLGLTGAVIVAGGIGVALVQLLRFPSGTLWLVVGATLGLVAFIRAVAARRS